MNQEQKVQARVREALEWVKWADKVVSELSDLEERGAKVYRDGGTSSIDRSVYVKHAGSGDFIELYQGNALTHGRYIVDRPYALVRKYEPRRVQYKKLDSALKRVRDDYEALERRAEYEAQRAKEREALQAESERKKAFLEQADLSGLVPVKPYFGPVTHYKFGDLVEGRLVADKQGDGSYEVVFNVKPVEFGTLNREEAELLGETVDEFKRALRKMRGEE